MRCKVVGSTPRSAQRANRSRSSVANPASSAGRSSRGQARGTVLEVTGEQFPDDAVLLGAGDQPRRRIPGALGGLAQHREGVAVHRTHQRFRAPPAGPPGPGEQPRASAHRGCGGHPGRASAAAPIRGRHGGDTGGGGVDQPGGLAGPRTAQRPERALEE